MRSYAKPRPLACRSGTAAVPWALEVSVEGRSAIETRGSSETKELEYPASLMAHWQHLLASFVRPEGLRWDLRLFAAQKNQNAEWLLRSALDSVLECGARRVERVHRAVLQS